MAVPLGILIVLEARQGKASIRLSHISDNVRAGGYLHFGVSPSMITPSNASSSRDSVLTEAELSAARSIYIINSTSGRYDLNSSGMPATFPEAQRGAKDDHSPAMIVGPPRKPFDSFFVNQSGVEPYQQLNVNADKQGMVLDFAVIGYPKCGTTTMIANLGQLAPIPAADICTPLHKTVWYAYHNWPREHGLDKPYRGVKCPAMIDSFGVGSPILRDLSKYLPRTKLIVGIRHPVKWYSSFYNMQAANLVIPPADDVYFTEKCERGCGKEFCKTGRLFCINRARFHLGLAQLMKTPLDEAERQWIPPELDASQPGVRNDIFPYDTDQLGDKDGGRTEQLWSDLGRFIGYDGTIPHDLYHGSHGRNRGNPRTPLIDICDARYDPIRATLLEHGYQMANWICPYFVEKGDKVFVSSKDYLCELVSQYQVDPCNRLVRSGNETYVIKDSNSITRVIRLDTQYIYSRANANVITPL